MTKKLAYPFLILILLLNTHGYVISAHTLKPTDDKPIYIQEFTIDDSRTMVFFENESEVTTTGPIAPLLNIAEITIIDGPLLKTKLIWFILNNRNLQLLIPFITINVQDLVFVVKYTRNISDRPIMQRFSYDTIIKEDENTTHIEEKHTLIVTGFNGVFGISRFKPFRITPAYFWFTGSFENLLIVQYNQ